MSKENVERIRKIVNLIRKRGFVTIDQLMDEFEVSRASVKRDFELLRSRLGCPLAWDRTKRGYVIRDDQLPGGGPFELPGLWFDSSEVLALLTMLHLLQGVQPGLLEEHLNPLKSRLRQLLGHGAHSATSIERRVKLIHFGNRKIEARHFQAVASAVLDRKQIRLRYWNRQRQEASDRVVSPLQLVHYRENWLLDAWCHKQDALRSFSLEAMQQVETLSVSAVDVDEEALAEHFQSGYGIFAGKATQRAKLKFTPVRAQWIASEAWHPEQTSTWLDDGSYVLEVPYSSDHELVMDLLRHGAEVEVLEPPELRSRVFEALCDAAKKYSPVVL